MNNYVVTQYNVHINDSYKYLKAEFEPVLRYLRVNFPDCEVFWHRSIKSMKREWACHNLLYNIHIERSHTKDVDINWPQKWYVTLAYDIFGAIAILFIK